MSKKRRHYTPQEKVMILKKNLLENVHVSYVMNIIYILPFFIDGRRSFLKKEAWSLKKKKGSYF